MAKKKQRQIRVTLGTIPIDLPFERMAPVTSLNVLEKAADHQRARAGTYDTKKKGGERSAAATAAAFNAITRREGDRALSESDVWLVLQTLKQVRLFTAPGYHADSAEDNVAYASLLAESVARAAGKAE